MSLINDMLRDLEARHSDGAPAALDGIAAAPAPAARAAGSGRRRILLGALLIGAAAAGWLLRPARPAPTSPVHAAAPARPVPVTAHAPPAAPPRPAAPPPRPTTTAVARPATTRETPPRARQRAQAAPPHTATAAAAPHAVVRHRSAAGSAPVVVHPLAVPRAPAATLYRHALERIRAGDTTAGETALQQVLRLDPGQERARELLAALWLRAGRSAAVESLLGPYVAAHPDAVAAVRLYARAQIAAGDAAAARHTLEAALPRAARDPDFDALLGAVYQRLGLYRRAAAAYRTALIFHPLDGPLWAGLGVALEAGGEGTAAHSAYRRALDLGGLTGPLARYVRSRLAAAD